MSASSPHQCHSLITTISFSGQDIPLSPSVSNLDVQIDPHLTFNSHVDHFGKISFFHLKRIASLRPSLLILKGLSMLSSPPGWTLASFFLVSPIKIFKNSMYSEPYCQKPFLSLTTSNRRPAS
ncbi:hypothetical protein XENOCAPTIV_017996 [Xenoophorus captivus]|uniref:Uncharacterized protein n=1 Tax=Xenoophorus captivus TaxID=1517983 RepID=A0ABV0QSF3_9TELE